jgi:GxxExxY protein
MKENELARKVIGLALKVHQELGPGLLERVYQECLYYEIKRANMEVKKEVPIPIKYDMLEIESAYRIDLLVENKLVIELKSVSDLHDIHFAQTLTYLRLANKRLGLLLNFNEILLKDGIRRVIN